MARAYHDPVMVREVVAYLGAESGGLYFDGTLGGGGHTEAILEASDDTRVIGVDQDPDALATAGARLERFGGRVRLVESNFADAAERLEESLAGALLDLGISSHQIDEETRGFSFRPGTPLDMRMAAGSAAVPTAADLLNELEERELADVFYRFGEERRSRRLAGEVVKRRRTQPFRTSDDLLGAIDTALGPRTTNQDRARIFQALRIAVNDEMGVLARALPALRDRLEPNGVFVVLSYHSLEDRQVKDAFREWSRDCVCPPELPVCRCRGRALGGLVTRKPVTAGASEVEANPRARSAKLRAWRKAA
ncbi:MAG TPA: 16S rRNA (cytosine(1402)-N(4))-methyltransferase RsmH [Longimicrobiales bacterium]|nr:16S rRNA (cytosine(1402)-N(4))-methyltransferase RsmH [Longimicrobiales bacterium]